MLLYREELWATLLQLREQLEGLSLTPELLPPEHEEALTLTLKQLRVQLRTLHHPKRRWSSKNTGREGKDVEQPALEHSIELIAFMVRVQEKDWLAAQAVAHGQGFSVNQMARMLVFEQLEAQVEVPPKLKGLGDGYHDQQIRFFCISTEFEQLEVMRGRTSLKSVSLLARTLLRTKMKQP